MALTDHDVFLYSPHTRTVASQVHIFKKKPQAKKKHLLILSAHISMTTLYQTYEDELRDLFKDINTELAELKATLQRDHPNYRPPPGAGPASRVARVKSLNDLNQKLRDLLKDMDRELSSADFPVNLREAARNRLTTEYRKNALTLEKDIVKAKQESSAADRADLVGSGGASSDVSAVSGLEGLDDETRRQRIQMAQNTAKLEKGSKDLKTGERLVIEMEDMSNQAITNLTAQTKTISNIVGKAHEGDEELSQARKILSDMHREMVKNKAILLIIILFLLLMIFLILYIKFGSSSSTTTTTVIIAATPTPGSIPSPPATSTSGSSLAGSQTF